MATKSSVFRLLIDKATAEDRAVHIEEIYRRVASAVILDEEDLKSTTLRGKATGEPAWKRNVRNVLQGMKSRGLLVNIEKNHWRKANPNQQPIISIANAWALIREKAKGMLAAKEVFHSPINKHRYQIINVQESKIETNRIDGNKSDFISTSEVQRAARIINAAGGVVGRRTLNHTVAKETAIVCLHPALRWSDDFSSILAIETQAFLGYISSTKPTRSQVIEAMNDNPADYQKAARRIRKGQTKFRKNLLKVYNQKCCISGTGPENVLQAAHIETHSLKGDNQSINGLLLRSDLHDLFDDNLIAVHPDTLEIFVHQGLKETVYFQLNGQKLRTRNDGRRPSRDHLWNRWQVFLPQES